ncbi:MAG: chemotaxis protein CheC [Gammaproteobacteria bacterium]
MELEALDADALGEVLNIAMGHAAAALSEMARTEVLMSIPALEVIDAVDYLEQFAGHDEDGLLVTISKEFVGACSGEGTLIFFIEHSMNLVRGILRDEVCAEDDAGLEQEVMTEVGSILLNCCLRAIGAVLGQSFQTSLPRFARGLPAELLPACMSARDGRALVARIDFALRNDDVAGHLALTLSDAALRGLLQALRARGLTIAAA